MNTSLPQDPIALLKAVSSLLPPEAQEQVRQALAAREAQRINRGVVVTGPGAIDDIDPTNEANTRFMHAQPGTLFAYGINSTTFGGFTSDKSRFVIVASDLLVQHRRHILGVIISDYLGDVPALELAGPDLIPGLFLFSGNKLYPRALSEKNLKLFIDYFEEAQTDRWYYPYWKFADERARQVEHWLSEEKQHGSM